MNLGFWEKINKPIIALAPMADVTDVTILGTPSALGAVILALLQSSKR